MTAPVELKIEGGIAFLGLTRPETRNALTLETLDLLNDALSTISTSSARATLLYAEGPAFCAGMDLKSVALENPATARLFADSLSRAYRNLLLHPLPLYCAVEGPAFGGAVGLALAADWVWLGPKARFALPEVKIGLVPALVSVVLSERVSPKTAQSLLVTGEIVEAKRALALGLGDGLSDNPREDLEEWIIASLRSHSSEAQVRTKAFLNEDRASLFDERLEKARDEFCVAVSTPAAQRGLAAFREKKEIDWTEEAAP